MGTFTFRSQLVTSTIVALAASLTFAGNVYAAAQLIPEHRYRLGSCDTGEACAWDCDGGSCFNDESECVVNADCPDVSDVCVPGPVCVDGPARSSCSLMPIDSFAAHLVIQVNDDACPGSAPIRLGLVGARRDGTTFTIRKELDLCGIPLACPDDNIANRDCDQCLQDPFSGDEFSCPLRDPVFLCNGQGSDFDEFNLNGDVGPWLNDIQSLDFIKAALVGDFPAGQPVVVSANELEFTQDKEAGFSEVRFCIRVELVEGRCVDDTGEPCYVDGDCNQGGCKVPGVAPVPPLLITDTTAFTIDGLAECVGLCGDGATDPGEQCDDGNNDDGDGCAFDCVNEPTTSALCDPTPVTTCLSGEKGSFQIKDKPDTAKDQLKWKLTKGVAFDQGALGIPESTTSYALCVYDETGDVAALAGSLTIGPGSSWESTAPKGYKYTDKLGSGDGVRKVQIKAGDAGKTKLLLKAGGSTLNWPTPVAGDKFFNADGKVTVQLVNSATPTCWTTDFASAKKNAGDQFKAKAP